LAELAGSLALPDGDTLAYRIAPSATLPSAGTIVLLHGLASNLTRWSEFVEQTSLTQHWDVLRVDLRGHGGSETRRGLSLERWCGDLAALLDREQRKDVLLIGHSLGAQVALHFAARYPARTRALVLIDPVFRQALHGKWRLLARAAPLFRFAAWCIRLLNALGLRRRSIPLLDLRELDTMARRALLTKESEQEFIRRYSSTRADLRTFRTAHYLQEMVAMFRPVPEPAEIRVPVLVLLSAGGTFAAPAAMKDVAQRFPQGRIVTIDCQHWPLTEKPVEVRAAIETFCEGLRGGDRT
jgi:pimeloyl-ACP methyl ester carboxylesterase